ncbi:hypothetical protein [Hymenobacter terrenus]|uniref:hypothetical protein n=1 Tax=Hymenobacter terrenus TaxID=1629124 RepID=UPI000619D206|nr:hypothetical protein [Hymenobacter terrenus]
MPLFMPLSPATSKALGFALLSLSGLATGTGLVLPLVSIELPRKPLWVSGCLIAGELLFATALVFLGKQYGRRLKLKLLAWFHRTFGWRPAAKRQSHAAGRP